MDLNQFKHIQLLLVDDEASFRQTLSKRFRKRGICTKQAASGKEALLIADTNPLDVVVMDVKMPGMTGLEVLNSLKNAHPEIEVILLTGHSAAPDGVQGIKGGAFDYLSKPIEFEHLLSKIGQAYEKKTRDAEREKEARYKQRIEQQMIATQRLAALGTLAAGVAHEINNPLAIINEASGYLGQLLEKETLADMPYKKTFQHALAKISDGVKRARTITHQLLESVRPHEPLLKETRLVQLIEETIDMVHKEAQDKMIQIRCTSDQKVQAVWIDPNQIRQILINLVTNAIHATNPNGLITVSLEKVENELALAVKDTGKGIAKENMERIFEPFFSDKPPGQGTGLGLFVTREIVEKLNGRLEVESRMGRGTVMKIFLPLTYETQFKETSK